MRSSYYFYAIFCVVSVIISAIVAIQNVLLGIVIFSGVITIAALFALARRKRIIHTQQGPMDVDQIEREVVRKLRARGIVVKRK